MRNVFWLRGLAIGLGITTAFDMAFGQSSIRVQDASQELRLPSSGWNSATAAYPSLTLEAAAASSPASPAGPRLALNDSLLQQPTPASSPEVSLIPPSSSLIPDQGQIVPLPPVAPQAPVYTQAPVAGYAPRAEVSAASIPAAPIPSSAIPPAPIPLDQTALPPPGEPTRGSVVGSGSGHAAGESTPAPIAIGDAVASPCSTSQGCSQGVPCGPRMQMVPPRPWIFGASGLVFDRIDNDYIRLSSTVSGSGSAALSSFDARMDTTGGFEVFGGRYLGCGRHAIIGNYWGLFPADRSYIVYDPELNTAGGDSLRSDLNFSTLGPGGNPATLHGIEMPGGPDMPGPNGGQNVYDWYDNAYAHRLSRFQDFHSFELNFFTFALGGAARQGLAPSTCEVGGEGSGGGWLNGRFGRHRPHGLSRAAGGDSGCSQEAGCADACGPGTALAAASCGPTGACGPTLGAQQSCLRLSWLGGVRWFRFRDYLGYATSETDAIFGTGSDDFYYRNDISNDLVGFQLGGLANYCTSRWLNVYAGSRFGVFANFIDYSTYAGTTSTPAIVSSYNPYDNQAFDLNASSTELALLGEGEVGLGLRLSPAITATCGYRLVGVSGVATATGQIPYDFSLLNDVQRIHSDQSLILHGVSIGGMYNW
jgi:hypothetical protein